MADLSDVEQALVDLVSATLYPAGTNEASVIGSLCRIYRGWPNAAALNSDLNAGVINVTLAPDNETGRVTTRYLQEWQTSYVAPGTLIHATGRTLEIGGTPAVGDLVGALVNDIPYVYRIQAGDTSDLVAANLGQIISQDHMVTVAGHLITVFDGYDIRCRAARDNTAIAETRRQEKNILIICWCPDPSSRDNVAAAIDAKISTVAFVPLADLSQARVGYHDTAVYDQSQNAQLFRRDLIYTVEYPSITRVSLPSMLFGDASINGSPRYG